MGYRNYIGYLPKREYNKIKRMSQKELCEYKGIKYEGEDDTYISSRDILTAELYEFGKYCDFETKSLTKRFFIDKDMNERFHNSDCEFMVVKDKEFLAKIIEKYRAQVASNYNEMVLPFKGEENKGHSEFLNSIKSNYSHSGTDYTFDFTKITPEEQTALFKMYDHIESISREWNWKVFDLEKGPEITTSWKYEYALFELVRIYKHFDWNKNVMVYYGW